MKIESRFGFLAPLITLQFRSVHFAMVRCCSDLQLSCSDFELNSGVGTTTVRVSKGKACW